MSIIDYSTVLHGKICRKIGRAEPFVLQESFCPLGIEGCFYPVGDHVCLLGEFSLV